jgi:hypothetical protein
MPYFRGKSLTTFSQCLLGISLSVASLCSLIPLQAGQFAVEFAPGWNFTLSQQARATQVTHADAPTIS